MKKAILLLFCTFAFALAHAQSKQQTIANQAAFTRLYGYVKYFYPGDEAAAINWDNFAIYGAKKVAGCKTREELKQALHNLFNPIVPTLQLADSGEHVTFNKQAVIPPSSQGYKTIAWQHVGVRTRALVYDFFPFKSARTNRPIYFDNVDQKFASVTNVMDAIPYRGKNFILKTRVKLAAGSGSGRLFIGGDTAEKKPGFLYNLEDNPITTTEWTDFELKGQIVSNAQLLRFGAALIGTGEFLIDDISLAIEDGHDWKNIYANNLNNEATGITNSGILSGSPKPYPGYVYSIVESPDKSANKWLSVKSNAAQIVKKHTTFFRDYPKVGEYINKNIGGGLKVMMPIALYGTVASTWPVADVNKLAELNRSLNNFSTQVNSPDSLATRFGNLTIAWNVFQHFFPYLDMTKTNWKSDLEQALDDALDDKNGSEFLKTLQKFTAKLKDEHVRVSWMKDENAFFPPVAWEWIENKLVVTGVLDDKIQLSKGDIITAIDNQAPEAYFKNVEQYIAAATPQGLTDRALGESLMGRDGTTLKLSYLNHSNVRGQVSLTRRIRYQNYFSALNVSDSVKRIGNDIMYLNIATVSGNTIDKLLPQLQKSKAIICDLRNSASDNWTTNHFMEYLLTKKDTATHWGQTAHIIYPDQERISGYDTEGFDLVPAKPHLNARIIFLVDATDYSWAETYISIVAHYKLATIVGQPTAGTNGDVNDFLLPGGYFITFSGLKITQLDLSPHQGVGTKPDVYVEKTIKGIREGKDEFLDKAIEIASATP